MSLPRTTGRIRTRLASAYGLESLKMPTLWMTVVGEVADAKLGPPDQDARAQFYQPVAQEEKEFGGLGRADRPVWQQRLHRGAVGAAAGPDGEHDARGWCGNSIHNCR